MQLLLELLKVVGQHFLFSFLLKKKMMVTQKNQSLVTLQHGAQQEAQQHWSRGACQAHLSPRIEHFAQKRRRTIRTHGPETTEKRRTPWPLSKRERRTNASSMFAERGWSRNFSFISMQGFPWTAFLQPRQQRPLRMDAWSPTLDCASLSDLLAPTTRRNLPSGVSVQFF